MRKTDGQLANTQEARGCCFINLLTWEEEEEEEEEGFDAMEDTDDDLMSDDYDSDTSQKSHETRKKSKCFKDFFENLDSLSIEKINEPERQWHSPAC